MRAPLLALAAVLLTAGCGSTTATPEQASDAPGGLTGPEQHYWRQLRRPCPGPPRSGTTPALAQGRDTSGTRRRRRARERSSWSSRPTWSTTPRRARAHDHLPRRSRLFFWSVGHRHRPGPGDRAVEHLGRRELRLQDR